MPAQICPASATSWPSGFRRPPAGVLGSISAGAAGSLPMGWSSWSAAHTGRRGPISSTSGRPGVRPGWARMGCGSADRGDGCPVLIVCWNDDAESVFQRLGSGMGIPLLTTTIKRLEEHGPLGNFGCWSVYGQPSHRPGSACFMAPATMRASWRYSGVNANLILRTWGDTLPGPRPEESVRSAISPGFRQSRSLSPEKRLEGPLRPFWRPLRAFRRRLRTHNPVGGETAAPVECTPPETGPAPVGPDMGGSPRNPGRRPQHLHRPPHP